MTPVKCLKGKTGIVHVHNHLNKVQYLFNKTRRKSYSPGNKGNNFHSSIISQRLKYTPP